MLYTDRIKNLNSAFPEMSRVWIKTGDPKTPLKSVWISDSAFRNMAEKSDSACEAETADISDDHLLLAA
jgi:hypothetical protein